MQRRIGKIQPDSRKAMKAMQYMNANRAVAEALKVAIHMEPGIDSRKLYQILSRTHDVSAGQTNFMLWGMRASGAIKAIGVTKEGNKQWRLVTASENPFETEVLMEKCIMDFLRQRPQWMNFLMDNVPRAVTGCGEKDVRNALKLMVKLRKIKPMRAEWLDGELYPDILLYSPETPDHKSRRHPVTSVRHATFLRLCDLRDQGYKIMTFKTLTPFFPNIGVLGLRKHLLALDEAGMLKYNRGAKPKDPITFDLSTLNANPTQDKKQPASEPAVVHGDASEAPTFEDLGEFAGEDEGLKLKYRDIVADIGKFLGDGSARDGVVAAGESQEGDTRVSTDAAGAPQGLAITSAFEDEDFDDGVGETAGVASEDSEAQ